MADLADWYIDIWNFWGPISSFGQVSWAMTSLVFMFSWINIVKIIVIDPLICNVVVKQGQKRIKTCCPEPTDYAHGVSICNEFLMSWLSRDQ